MPLREALIEAGAIRLRPILMTTFALIAGMIPVALGRGEGARLPRAARPRGDRRRDHVDAADAARDPDVLRDPRRVARLDSREAAPQPRTFAPGRGRRRLYSPLVPTKLADRPHSANSGEGAVTRLRCHHTWSMIGVQEGSMRSSVVVLDRLWCGSRGPATQPTSTAGARDHDVRWSRRLYDGHYILSVNLGFMVGGLNDPAGWNAHRQRCEVGDADIPKKLLAGHKAGDKTFKVHIDGYNLLPFLTVKGEKSPRQGVVYFDDDGNLVALRAGNWKAVLMEQRVQGTLRIWAKPFTVLRLPSCSTSGRTLRAGGHHIEHLLGLVHFQGLHGHGGQAVVQPFLETLKEISPAAEGGELHARPGPREDGRVVQQRTLNGGSPDDGIEHSVTVLAAESGLQ